MSQNAIRDALNRYTPAQLASINRAVKTLAGLPLGVTANGEIAVKMQVVQGAISILTPLQQLINSLIDLGSVQGLWIADAGCYVTAGGAAAVDGDPVGQWQDQSGFANHAAIGVLLDRPTFGANVVHGRASLAFNGVNQLLNIPDLTSHFPTEAAACIVTGPSISGSNRCFETYPNDGYFRYAGTGSGYIDIFRAERLTSYPSVVSNTEFYNISVESSSSSYQAFLNGIGQGVQLPAFHSGGLFTIGFNSVYSDAPVAAVVLLNQVSDRAAADALLIAYYGL